MWENNLTATTPEDRCRGLLEIAALAIPAINEVETAGRATPSE